MRWHCDWWCQCQFQYQYNCHWLMNYFYAYAGCGSQGRFLQREERQGKWHDDHVHPQQVVSRHGMTRHDMLCRFMSCRSMYNWLAYVMRFMFIVDDMNASCHDMSGQHILCNVMNNMMSMFNLEQSVRKYIATQQRNLFLLLLKPSSRMPD